MNTQLTLAEVNKRLTGISEGFTSTESSTMLYILASIMCLIALALAIYQGIILFRRLRVRMEPKALFAQFANELGTDWDQRKCLTLIARHEKLDTPLTLLLSPSTLDHHAGNYKRSLSPPNADRVAGIVAEINKLMAK